MNTFPIRDTGSSIKEAFNTIKDKDLKVANSIKLWEHAFNPQSKLVIMYSSGRYYLNNKSVDVNHIAVIHFSSESSMVDDTPGAMAWYANHPQYFHHTQIDEAIETFVNRAVTEDGFKAHGCNDNSVMAVYEIDEAYKKKLNADPFTGLHSDLNTYGLWRCIEHAIQVFETREDYALRKRNASMKQLDTHAEWITELKAFSEILDTSKTEGYLNTPKACFALGRLCATHRSVLLSGSPDLNNNYDTLISILTDRFMNGNRLY